MSLWKKLFGGEGKGADPLEVPWDRRPSILEFVRTQIDESKPGLMEGAHRLPDEEPADGKKVRWAAGALDGVTTHHMSGGDQEETVQRTITLVLAYCGQPTVANKAAVYRHVKDKEGRVVSIIDPVLGALRTEEKLDHGRLYELARSFVTEAPDREPVKFGIAVLGLFAQPDDQELFQTLGRHDEFTLYCAVALASGSESPEEALWTLAKNVEGWGRIHIVERLAETTNPAIKDWLLRDGFRNSVMYEYLAVPCARGGELAAALSRADVDRELLSSASEIIQAILSGGPAEDIDSYEDAPAALEAFVGHMESSAETVKEFVAVQAIKSFLDQDDEQWSARYERGWTPEGRSTLREKCDSILARPEWHERVVRGLRSEDHAVFYNAASAAKTLGIDPWDIYFERLERVPTDSNRWFYVMSVCDETGIDEVLEFAEAKIGLSKIATGPAEEMGFGPEFEPHSCLGMVLQELSRFPAKGTRLIEAGLRSPVVRNRNMAVKVLAAWPRADWPPHLERLLLEAVLIEPNDETKEWMRKSLRGEELS